MTRFLITVPGDSTQLPLTTLHCLPKLQLIIVLDIFEQSSVKNFAAYAAATAASTTANALLHPTIHYTINVCPIIQT